MNQHISHEQTRGFFMLLPSILDYLELTPHEFRLYSHYIRVCGDETGKCWESVRTTAAHCNIGKSTIGDTRDVLEDKYHLIYTNRHLHQPGSRATVHVKVRDIWDINGRFLTMIRKHGMPSLETAQKWILHELGQDINPSPFEEVIIEEEIDESPEPPELPDIHFSVPEDDCPPHGQSIGEEISVRHADSAVRHTDNCPSHGQLSATRTELSTARTTVHDTDRDVHHADSSVRHEGHNKIHNKKIPVNKIDSNKIPSNKIQLTNAAAAAGSLPLKVNNLANPTDARARIGTEQASEEAVGVDIADDLIWWEAAGQWVSRVAVEQVCIAFMDMDDWRDKSQIVEAADHRELFNLLLWLKYSDWNELQGIDSRPGYIRSRYKGGAPAFSKRDMEQLLERISQHTTLDAISF